MRRVRSENPRPLLSVRGGQEMARHVSAVFPVRPNPGNRNQMFLPGWQHILQGRLPKVSPTFCYVDICPRYFVHHLILCIVYEKVFAVCVDRDVGKPLLILYISSNFKINKILL